MRELVFAISIALAYATSSTAQEIVPYAFDIGAPSVTDYYVDPVGGSDENNGLSQSSPWRTVQRAWGAIPQSTTLDLGFRINLMNGTYGSEELPSYWELRRGTFQNPIILRAAPGQSDVRFASDINMANVSHFYLIGVEIRPEPAGDTFHCESCDHILLRGNVFDGGSTSEGAHETVKFNQSQFVYIENNRISNADDNNIDLVAVQYGHIIGNSVSGAVDWCAYAKGGSAYIRVEGNTFSDCGTGGFTAGQGSGFQFMTSPWIHYEAYDIKVINNVFHDISGAAFGVNGGYNVLIANNTAYKVGTRSHTIEVVFGERTCDGSPDGAPEPTCSTHNSSGGWGPPQVSTTPDYVGNRNVIIANNVIYNPAGTAAPQHLAVYGPRTPTSGRNIPAPQVTDTNLVIRGNVIWNGDGGTRLGIEDSSEGCQPSNPTCNQDQLRAENTINTIEPILADAAGGDFRPLAGGALLGLSGVTLPDFPGGDRVATPQAPVGELSNSFDRDLSGTASSGARVPGAYSSATVPLSPPDIGDTGAPSDPGNGGSSEAPVFDGRLAVKIKKKGARRALTVTARISGSPSAVTATVTKGRRTLAAFPLSETAAASGIYKGKGSAKARSGARLRIDVEASNESGSASRQRSAKVP